MTLYFQSKAIAAMVLKTLTHMNYVAISNVYKGGYKITVHSKLVWGDF